MKTRKNILRKRVSIAILAFMFLNLCACRSSNQVVSKRIIQKRKYTSGWFVKSSKPGWHAKKIELRTEVSPINPKEKWESHQKVNLLEINQAKELKYKKEPQEIQLVSTVFRTKREKNKVETAARLNQNVFISELDDDPKTGEDISSLHQEKSNLYKHSPRKRKHNIDPFFIILGILLVIGIICLIIDFKLTIAVVTLIGAIVMLGMLVYIIFLFFRGMIRLFDLMF